VQAWILDEDEPAPLADLAADAAVDRMLGRRVRLARRARGLTQAQLAAALHVERPLITRLELGSRSASAGRIRALAVALAVSPGYLLGL